MVKRIPTRLEKDGHVRVDDYYWLRERDNPEVIAYLKTHHLDLLRSVIVVSADPSALRGEYPQPICRFLAKPFDVDEFVNLVKTRGTKAGDAIPIAPEVEAALHAEMIRRAPYYRDALKWAFTQQPFLPPQGPSWRRSPGWEGPSRSASARPGSATPLSSCSAVVMASCEQPCASRCPRRAAPWPNSP